MDIILAEKYVSYLVTVYLQVDGADRAELKINACDLPHLSHDKALQAMLNEIRVQKLIKSGIARSNYEFYPDCRAILHIYTNRHKKSKDVVKPIESFNKS